MTVEQYVERRKDFLNSDGRHTEEGREAKAACDAWWETASKADKERSGPLYFAMYDRWASANPSRPRR